MFTGLVQDVGTVERVLPGPMTTLWIRTALGAGEFTPGESIAVSGACLTVVERDADRFRVDAAPETLRRTTLGALSAGDRVNLEPALRVGDRMGGHWVQGHVDGVGEIVRIEPEGEAQNFGQVRNSFIRIYNADTNEEICKYELEEDFSIETAVEFGRLYKKGGGWKFEAVGKGYPGGLAHFVSKYT